MKKIILIFIFCTFLSIGGFIFINKNFSSSKIRARDYILVKGEGKGVYNYELPFKKGTSIKEIIKLLIDSDSKISSIRIRENRKWITVTESRKIYHDTTIKI